jgi:hypothetical protein
LKEDKTDNFGLDYEEVEKDNYSNLYQNVNYIRIAVSRNLFECPYNTIITKDKRESIETLIAKAIETLRSDNILKPGKYLSLAENEAEIEKVLLALTDYESMNEYMKKADLKTGKYIIRI